jgi:serine/threonine protein kinase
VSPRQQPSEPAMPSDTTPPPLGRFEFERLLRKDALSETWRALDTNSGTKADLRMLPEWADPSTLQDRVKAQAGLSHQVLIHAREIIGELPRAAVVLDPHDGETIAQRRSRRPRRHFEVSEIKPWMRKIADALGSLHERGQAHGAIHMGSFLIEGAEFCLTDFVVAPLLRPQKRFEGGAMLPLAAMSPQAMSGAEPTPADDIYSVASLAYDLLTGQPVFSSGDIATQVQSTPPPSITRRREELEVAGAPVPEDWERWLAAALSKNPADRPTLVEFYELLQSGTFQSATSRKTTSVSPKPVIVGYSSSPVQRSGPAISLSYVILGSSLLLTAALLSSIYFLRVAPRQEFKQLLDAAYAHALEFDSKSPSEHAAVIARWEQFEKEWQGPVSTRYPIFSDILTAADTRRRERESSKERAEEDARQEELQLRMDYVSRAKLAMDGVRAATANVTPGTRDKAISAWASFLDSYGKDFQGKPVPELVAMLDEARTRQDKLRQAAADEKKRVEDYLAKTSNEMASLREKLGDPATAAGSKTAMLSEFISRISAAPRDLKEEPKLQDLRREAEDILPSLQSLAESETPKNPLDVTTLFSASPCKEFSENGRKHVLKDAQAALKKLELYKSNPDGSPGKGTHDAILAFQKSKNLPVTAALDETTLNALGLADLQDDSSPLPSAAPSAAHRQSSKSSSKKPEEESKGLLQKVGGGLKTAGKSIGNFFTGGDKK